MTDSDRLINYIVRKLRGANFEELHVLSNFVTFYLDARRKVTGDTAE